jgi:Ni/Co efflux regulator RcnB
MKKVVSMMALVAFLFAGVANAQQKPETKEKAKTEKKEAKADKKEAKADKKEAKKAEAKK